MAIHLFRPVDAPEASSPPVGVSPRHLRAVAVPQLLARLWALCGHPAARRALRTCLILLGVVVQALMLLTAAYLCDLALSLMELWAELARKHLELTL